MTFIVLLVFHLENVWWLCWFCALVLLNFNQEEMQAQNVDIPSIQSNKRTKYLESRFVCEIFFFDFVVFFALRRQDVVLDFGKATSIDVKERLSMENFDNIVKLMNLPLQNQFIVVKFMEVMNNHTGFKSGQMAIQVLMCGMFCWCWGI